MPAKSLIKVIDALTTWRGAVAGAIALLALGFAMALGSTPAVSTGAKMVVAQADTSGPFSAEQKEAIERIVRDYLVKNPEVLLEVGRELEKRQAEMQVAEHKRIIVENRDKIFASP